MRVLKAFVAWSGPGAGTKLFHSQRIGAEKPRILSATVDRGFCAQSMYGLKTYDHKYTLRLENSDGALDQYRTLWSTDQAIFAVHAADDASFAGTTWATDATAVDRKFAQYITRVIFSTSEVILESDGGNIKKHLDVRLAQFYSAIYNTFTQNKPQLWAAGRVTVDLDAYQVVGASTDFDTGIRDAEYVQVFADVIIKTPAAAVGAGDFSLTTTAVEGKRIAGKLAQPTAASPCSCGTAFDDIMTSIGYPAGANWSRGALTQAIGVGVSARDETRLQTIEKILAGFDAGLYQRNDGGGIAVAMLQDFYEIPAIVPAYELTQDKIMQIEVENAPFDGLGKLISWNQNDAVHNSQSSTITDTYKLQSPDEQAAMAVTFADYYANNAGVKERVFKTWFTSQSTLAATFLQGFYSAENMLLNISAVGFDLQELNPGAHVNVTHERFDLGITPNTFQLLSLRYDLMLMTTSMQLVGKKRAGATPVVVTNYRYWRLAVDSIQTPSLFVVGIQYFKVSVASGGASIFTGGTPSASSEYSASYTAARAFDDDNTLWTSILGGIPGYVQYDLGAGNATSAAFLEVRAYPPNHSYSPKLLRLQGSNDGATWTDLLSVNILGYSTSDAYVIDSYGTLRIPF